MKNNGEDKQSILYTILQTNNSICQNLPFKLSWKLYDSSHFKKVMIIAIKHEEALPIFNRKRKNYERQI